MYAIQIEHLFVTHQQVPILWDVTTAIPTGTLVAVIGPNGAGKTTLIKSIVGLISPVAGTIRVFGKSIESYRDKVAYIPQRMSIDWDFPATVLDVVLMGRYRALGWFARPSVVDYDCAHEALQAVGLQEFAHRPISQLSGGQQQRVFVARALVQEALLYLLDEPFIGVDTVSEQVMISLLQKMRDQGKTIVVVHHDLQTVSDYFDYVLLLNVRHIASGPTHEVLMPEYVCAAYGKRDLLVTRYKKSSVQL